MTVVEIKINAIGKKKWLRLSRYKETWGRLAENFSDEIDYSEAKTMKGSGHNL
jgi:hypothetical protein